MFKEDEEYIGLEELKNRLSNLSPKDIVSFAFKNWIPCQKSGYTIMNIETGLVGGLSIDINELPLKNSEYIELYSILSSEDPIKPSDLFSSDEFEEYLEFKGEDPSEYTPDIVSDFCTKKDIDESSRKISILADRFEEEEYYNYNQWESGIINKYHDMIQDPDELYD